MADYQRRASHFVCGAAMFLATMSIAACGDALAGTYSLRQNQQNANAARMFGMPDGGSRMTASWSKARSRASCRSEVFRAIVL
jgi:hypothetical protein